MSGKFNRSSSNWDKYWNENEYIDSVNKNIEEKGLL